MEIKSLGNQTGTFIIDLMLLPWFFGPLLVFLATRYFYRCFGRKKWIIPALSLLTISGFWLIAGGLYFNSISPYPLSGLSGNDFMWNWPFNLIGLKLVNQIPTYVDFWGWLNILALLIFIVVYPFMLYLGIQIGYLLLGRSEKQKGVSDFLFKRSLKSEFK